ncbi:MAG: caspase family protein [Thalassobaculaceae bacterium]
MAVAILGAVALATPAVALDAGKLGLPGAARLTPPSTPPSTPRAGTLRETGMVRENRDAIAVIIGNRRYAHGLPEVRYAENDAEAVRRFVVDLLGYRDGNVIDLRNASQAEMLSVFGNASDHRGKLVWFVPTTSTRAMGPPYACFRKTGRGSYGLALRISSEGRRWPAGLPVA